MDNKQQRLRTSLQENYYITPSYQVYGGSSGFHDFGILGKKLKNKLVNMWRDYFINDETDTIVEIETPTIMPYDILNASGHVQRFTDYIVYDENNICYRADHLAKNWFKANNLSHLADQVDTWNRQVLQENINNYKMIKPKTPNTFVEVTTKNLMFEVPSTSNNFGIDFLRPELAQGIFVSYNNCQKFLQKEPPFGIAQTGTSYRKEISPQPYVRMREFNQAEIEYFFDPTNKSHHNFDIYKNISVPILTSEMQLNNETKPIIVTLESAIENKLISSQLMAYFIGRVYLFAMKVGLKPDKVRFRQHLPHEMSHYAVECWDLETFVNDDWLECVGIADRGSYDLSSHNNHTVPKVYAKRVLNVPVEIKFLKAKLNMKVIGQTFGDTTAIIRDYFGNMSENNLQDLKNILVDPNVNHITFETNKKQYSINKSMVEVVEESQVKVHESYVPHVLEPSFGVDRLLYSILEQNFWARESDTQRIVLSLPNELLPYDVAVFPLSKNIKFNPVIEQISKDLNQSKFTIYKDNSSTSIGKKYSRADEMGIKFAITIDFDTFNDNQVTIRERDSTKQIRVSIVDIAKHLKQIISSCN